MKVSVAMTTFNGGLYLQEQLDSIRRQSLLPEELIVCDDGSSDETLDIVRRFATEAPFKVIVDAHGERLGYNRNFVRAIGHCTGEIVALCDQDDVWESGKLAATVAVFADKSVVTVTHQVRVVDAGLRPTDIPLPPTAYRGKYTVFNMDPWFAPNGMQLLFRRLAITPWLHGTPPLSAYGFGTAPFDEWIFFIGTLVGTAVVMKEDFGVWRRHDSVASIVLENVEKDQSAAHQWHLAMHSGGEAYSFRADVTEARADFAAQTIVLPDGHRVTAVAGAVEFYREMAGMFRRRVELHDPGSARPQRLRIFVRMLARNDYRSRDLGGLGAKAILKDGFTIFFGPRTPIDSLGPVEKPG